MACWEQLPVPSQMGKTKVGGMDLNKVRMRWVIDAVMAQAPSPRGFIASELETRQASGVTSKPAIEGHFKTGQRNDHPG
jgi:hypothetical protein